MLPLSISFLRLPVSFDIKVTEENDERDHVGDLEPAEEQREITALYIQTNQMQTVDEHNNKLRQLHASKIPLPPQILLHVRTEGGQQVVRIHDHVDETIAQRSHVRCTARYKLQHGPSDDGHRGVVVNMEEGDLVVLLACDEEECVDELDDLGSEVPPVCVDQSHRRW